MIRPTKQTSRRLIGLAVAAAACPTPGHAQESAPQAGSLPTVEVVSTTPVPGIEVPKDQIPSNVQTADDLHLRRAQSLNLPDFLATQMPSVNVNEIQGNPYQVDVNYRGFSASPVLGTPQGLSVYQDGVRINEPFGDVVNWDLIPKAAISSITLLPGSNPLFGLNTLGGALSLQTKRGDTHPGTELELQAGSFGRVSTELSHGRKLAEGGHLFLAFGGLNEDGWRNYSPSRVRQLFAKVGQDSGKLSWDLSFTHGDNQLVGNGLLPESMLMQNRKQVYTRPDRTGNRMSMLTLNGSYRLSDQQTISMTAYTRRSRYSTLNGDLNDDFDPAENGNSGVENRTYTRQHGEGVALQSTYAAGMHQFTFGASVDRARTHFLQTEAEGILDATRAVVPLEEAEVDALLAGKSRTASVYFSDLVTLRPDLQLSLSGRYNDTRVTTRDDGRALLGLATQLDGEGRYKKFNPAIGLTWQATPQLTAYAGWSQGSRAPSPIELGCSDPQNACVLPNALQSDPPLRWCRRPSKPACAAPSRRACDGMRRCSARSTRTICCLSAAGSRAATSATSGAPCARALNSASRSRPSASTGRCRTATCAQDTTPRHAWWPKRTAAPRPAPPAPAKAKSRCGAAIGCRACRRIRSSSTSIGA